MATIRRVIVTCDKNDCGRPAPHRNPFFVNGRQRQLDLCDQHQSQMLRAVEPWVSAAYVTPAPKRTRSKRK